MLIILTKTKSEDFTSYKHHDRLADDFQDTAYREDNTKKLEYTLSDRAKLESNILLIESSLKQKLIEAKERIEELERKIAILDGRIPQKYPDVKYLGHKERKRVLVSYLYLF